MVHGCSSCFHESADWGANPSLHKVTKTRVEATYEFTAVACKNCSAFNATETAIQNQGFGPCSMTGGAQQALRRTMEIYSNTTRFALACNTSSKIIEPIQSRCAIVRYSKLGEKDILERLLHVCQHEKVSHISETAQVIPDSIAACHNNMQQECMDARAGTDAESAEGS